MQHGAPESQFCRHFVFARGGKGSVTPEGRRGTAPRTALRVHRVQYSTEMSEILQPRCPISNQSSIHSLDSIFEIFRYSHTAERCLIGVDPDKAIFADLAMWLPRLCP